MKKKPKKWRPKKAPEFYHFEWVEVEKGFWHALWRVLVLAVGASVLMAGVLFLFLL